MPWIDKEELQRQLDRTYERGQRDGEWAEYEVWKAKVQEEYAKHVPEFVPMSVRLGDRINVESKFEHFFLCSHPQCNNEWPCPTWHLLRRIYNADDTATYRMRMTKEPKSDD